MNLGSLYLKINLISISILAKLDWIINYQFNISRVEEPLVINLGGLLDLGDINIG